MWAVERQRERENGPHKTIWNGKLTFDSMLSAASPTKLVACKYLSLLLALGRASVVDCVQNKSKHSKNHCMRIFTKRPLNSYNFRNNFTAHGAWDRCRFKCHWIVSVINTSLHVRQCLRPLRSLRSLRSLCSTAWFFTCVDWRRLEWKLHWLL